MADTKDDTIFGGAEVSQTASHAKAASLPILTQNAKPVTKKEVPFGSQSERLAILQQATSDYQKSGGQVRVGYRDDADSLVIVLVGVGQCVDCGTWFSGNDGCQRCAKNFGRGAG